MKFYKRILSSFFAVVIMVSAICTPYAQAALVNDVAYYYTQSSWAPYVMSYSLQLLGVAGDVAFPEVPGVGTILATCADKGINTLMEYYAAGYTDDDFYTAERNYVSDLDSTTVSSGVLLDLFFCQNSSGVLTPFMDTSDVVNGVYGNVVISGNSISFDVLGSSGKDVYYGAYFTVPETASYVISTGSSYGLKTSSSGYFFYYSSDGGSSWKTLYSDGQEGVSIDDSYERFDYVDRTHTFSTSLLYCFAYYYNAPRAGSPVVWIFDVPPTVRKSGETSMPESTTRTASLMQTINNYNNVDNSTNFYIGTLVDGAVENTYDPALYDEETLVFTEPITGAQYQTTGWTYDYETRTYSLDLEDGTITVDGTDVTTIEIAYKDDCVAIDYYSADATVLAYDEFAYVIAEKVDSPTCVHEYSSEITDPTCIDYGKTVYTCTRCGHTYTETIPALGHDWLATEVIDTTYALPDGTSCPSCGSTAFTYIRSDDIYSCTCSDCGAEWTVEADVTYGSTTYTCSRCGESYVEQEDEESGLFAALANFLSDGITWITDKFMELAESVNGIHTTFRNYMQKIQNVGGDFPTMLGAAIGVMPDDFMSVIWFSVIALVILAVWLKFFK